VVDEKLEKLDGIVLVHFSSICFAGINFVFFHFQVLAINLKPVKRIHFKVDPLHPNSHSNRQFMQQLTNKYVKRTSAKTAFKYDFLSDRSEPSITFTFHDDERTVVFQTANLTNHEIIYEMNKITLPLVKEDKVATGTKGAKAAKKK
jgi:hypothetical protein